MRQLDECNRARILIIDDEAVIREGCQQILTDDGHDVQVALDGEKGIARARDMGPEIVLVDIRMPGVGGLEVIRQILTMDPEVIPIVITGYATVEYAVQSIKSGAFDFLPKPFSPAELRQAVRHGIEKRRMRARMHALDEEKRRLTEYYTSVVSHQLRAPIAAVRQNFEVILGNMAGEITDESREILTRASVRLDELMELIQDWLSLSKLDREKMQESFAPVDLSALVERQVELVGPEASARSIRVETRLDDDLPAVLGSRAALGEAVANLLSNAVKYNVDGGLVTVRLASREGGCAIEVHDTGIGIPEDKQELVFDDFYRVRDERTEGIRGTGLGLSIVRKIATIHGGVADVRTEPGAGSTFRILLPAWQDEHAQGPTGSTFAASAPEATSTGRAEIT